MTLLPSRPEEGSGESWLACTPTSSGVALSNIAPRIHAYASIGRSSALPPLLVVKGLRSVSHALLVRHPVTSLQLSDDIRLPTSATDYASRTAKTQYTFDRLPNPLCWRARHLFSDSILSSPQSSHRASDTTFSLFRVSKAHDVQLASSDSL